MIRYTLQVEGMACAKCEEHVNEAVKKAFSVKKVESFRKEKKTVVLTVKPIDEGALRRAVEESGFKVIGILSEEEKGSLFSWFKR